MKEELKNCITDVLKNAKGILSPDILKTTRGGLPILILWEKCCSGKDINFMKDIVFQLLDEDKTIYSIDISSGEKVHLTRNVDDGKFIFICLKKLKE